MEITIYHVDAFTDKVFGGNPVVVCPLNSWLQDEVLQNIAMELCVPETAFYVKQDDQYEIRWFTPAGTEVDFCGHATLASAFVISNYGEIQQDVIRFYSSRSGLLTVTKNNDFFSLNFPADNTIEPVKLTKEINNCFVITPISVFKGKTDYLFLFDREEIIKNLRPNLNVIAQLPVRGVIITAKGNMVDFVSRFFAPQIGINEDPVTDSAHTTLTPYWKNILDKEELTAIQLSKRKGFLKCRYLGSKIEISGQANLFSVNKINI